MLYFRDQKGFLYDYVWTDPTWLANSIVRDRDREIEIKRAREG